MPVRGEIGARGGRVGGGRGRRRGRGRRARAAGTASELVFTALGDDEHGRRAERTRGSAAFAFASAWRETGAADGGRLRRRGRRAHDHRNRRRSSRPRAQDDLPWEELDGADERLLHRRRRDGAAVGSAAGRGCSWRRRASCRRCRWPASSSMRSSRAGRMRGSATGPGDLDPPPKLVVSTAGALGGWAQPGGPFRAAGGSRGRSRTPTAPGTPSPAALTFALAEGRPVHDALAFASERGGEALMRRGAVRRRPPRPRESCSSRRRRTDRHRRIVCAPWSSRLDKWEAVGQSGDHPRLPCF